MSVLSLLTAIVAACAVTAGAIARARPRYRPVTALLGWLLSLDLARAGIQVLCLLGAPTPYTGTTAAIFHLEQSLALSWPVAVVAAAVAVFLRRRPWLMLVPWAALSAGFALAYPWLRLDRRDKAHAVVATAAIVAVAACAAKSFIARRDRWGVEHVAIGAIVAAEFGAAAVVLWWPSPAAHWDIARLVFAFVYGLLLAAQVWQIRRSG